MSHARAVTAAPAAIARPIATAIAIALATLSGAAPAKTKTDPPPAPQAPAIPDKAGTWSNFPAPAQTGPFFQALGTNGRTCGTCHAPNDGWTATPGQLQKRFAATNGADPIFLSLDGTNCPSLPVATVAQHQAASSLLLGKGLIRVALTPPAGADFTIASVSNPYGCSSTTTVSVYRRILATSNLAFLSNVMWDGRESRSGANIYGDLVSQANDAVATHAAGTVAAPAATIASVVAFEVEQFAAQVSDATAGALTPSGGPSAAAAQAFTPGENPGGTTAVFTLYSAWESLVPTATSSAALLKQASIGRGEKLFNTMTFSITKVGGLNDQPGPNGQLRTIVTGTCGTCHNATNAGSHSTPLLLETGQANLHPAAAGQTQDLPVFTLVNNATHKTWQVTDPGAALTTGKWADIGKFKVPTLRNLAARQPYFHDGSAPSLDAVVDFYNTRFTLNLSAQQHADLVAFLGAL